MCHAQRTRLFPKLDKDVKTMKKRVKNINKLKQIITKLVKGEILEAKYKDHKIIENYVDRQECHIEPDWLLIYLD
ncbi:MAG: type II toxin-antitoxin system YafQ family toxin [Cyanobacterium sp.]